MKHCHKTVTKEMKVLKKQSTTSMTSSKENKTNDKKYSST